MTDPSDRHALIVGASVAVLIGGPMLFAIAAGFTALGVWFLRLAGLA